MKTITEFFGTQIQSGVKKYNELYKALMPAPQKPLQKTPKGNKSKPASAKKEQSNKNAAPGELVLGKIKNQAQLDATAQILAAQENLSDKSVGNTQITEALPQEGAATQSAADPVAQNEEALSTDSNEMQKTESAGSDLVASQDQAAQQSAPQKTKEQIIEEIKTNLAEEFKLEGDKLKHFVNSVECTKDKSNFLKRVIVLQLTEGEKSPAGAFEKEGFAYVIEYFPMPARSAKMGDFRQNDRFGGRDRKGGRAGRDGDKRGRGGRGDKKPGRRPEGTFGEKPTGDYAPKETREFKPRAPRRVFDDSPKVPVKPNPNGVVFKKLDKPVHEAVVTDQATQKS